MRAASQCLEYIPKLADQAAAPEKKAVVEEWGVGTQSNYDGVAKQAAVFNSPGVPWVIVPPNQLHD